MFNLFSSWLLLVFSLYLVLTVLLSYILKMFFFCTGVIGWSIIGFVNLDVQVSSQVWEIFAITFLSKISASFSLSSPSGIQIIPIFVLLMESHRSHKLFHFINSLMFVPLWLCISKFLACRSIFGSHLQSTVADALFFIPFIESFS